jgi:uncharacterized protein
MPMSVDFSKWQVSREVGPPLISDAFGGDRSGIELSRIYNFSGLQGGPDTTATLKLECRLESGFVGFGINSSLFLFFRPFLLANEKSLLMGLFTSDQSKAEMYEVCASPVEGARDTVLLAVGLGAHGKEDVQKCVAAISSGKEMFFMLGDVPDRSKAGDEQTGPFVKLPLPNDGEFKQLYNDTYERLMCAAQDATRDTSFLERWQRSAAARPFDDGDAAFERGDYVTAMRLWRPLADQGRVVAQTNLGVMYEKGQGVPQDYAAAVSWYRKAADQGFVASQHFLGNRYLNGQGVPQDYAAAMSWFRKAADQGYAAAQASLGIMYEKGQGGTLDYATAVSLFRKAADQGNAAGQYKLGTLYEEGQGVPQDYAAAVGWFRKAADQDDTAAQCSLGYMYFSGQGVPQDYVAAMSWVQKAANQGFSAAQNMLGHMYYRGHGVPQNYVGAHMWWNLSAATGGKDAAKNRDIVAGKMTPAPQHSPHFVK